MDGDSGRRGPRRRFLFGGPLSDGAVSLAAAAPATDEELPSELGDGASTGVHIRTGPAAGLRVVETGYYPTALPFTDPTDCGTIDDTVKFNALGCEGELYKQPEGGAAEESDLTPASGAGMAPVADSAAQLSALATNGGGRVLRDADGVAVHMPSARYEVESAPPPNGAANLLVSPETNAFCTNDEVYLVQMPPVLPFTGVSVEKQRRQAAARASRAAAARASAAATSSSNAPSGLAAIQGSIYKSDKQAAPKAAAAPEAAPELPPSENPAACMPPGRIGKLRVHRSGRLTMLINDVVYEVSPGVQASFHQQLVDIDAASGQATALCGVQRKMVVFPSPKSLVDPSARC